MPATRCPGPRSSSSAKRSTSASSTRVSTHSSQDDVCTLIYTSGTTGAPKAVMLSHANITWVLEQASADRRDAAGRRHRELPRAEPRRRAALLAAQQRGARHVDLVRREPRDRRRRAAAVARPHHFLGVPRVWEKMQAKMEAAGAKNSPLQEADRRVGPERRPRGRLRRPAGTAASAAVSARRTGSCSRRFGETLGLDRARSLVTGAAPISSRTLDFFLSLGLPILEVVRHERVRPRCTTCCSPKRYRTGKAGYVLPGTEVRVAGDGEICMRGPHVFKGYLGDTSSDGRGDRCRGLAALRRHRRVR